MKVISLFTCFNRKKFTLRVINQLLNEQTTNIEIDICVVDDASTDGTKEEITSMNKPNIEVIQTKGNYYYTGGMIYGMQHILQSDKEYDYLLILNDDVDFNKDFLSKMIENSIENDNPILVGATKDNNGNLSYGGIKYKNKKSEIYDMIGPLNNICCDTFNANCVLIPYSAFKKVGTMDKHFIHSLGDFDYGLQFKKNNYKIMVANEYVGFCNRNSDNIGWKDTSLSRITRIKKLNIPKGNPTKQTFYYFKKNFNLKLALKYSIIPYLKILLKK